MTKTAVASADFNDQPLSADLQRLIEIIDALEALKRAIVAHDAVLNLKLNDPHVEQVRPAKPIENLFKTWSL